MQGYVFIATSLDGYIARENGAVEWLACVEKQGEDYGYARFIAEMDGIIMGRGTYEKVRSFGYWPYDIPVVVMSKTLADMPPSDELDRRVSFTRQSPKALMDELAEEGWKKVYVDGGLVVQSFLMAGLIHEMTISRIPVLIGKGRSLFGDAGRDIDLRHIETTAFDSGLVQSRYEVIG